MSYGLQIFNQAGGDIVGGSRNVFVEQFIPVNGAGTTYYNLGPDEKLDAFVIALEERGANDKHAVQNITVSGNAVSWDTVYGSSIQFYIMVVKSGVY